MENYTFLHYSDETETASESATANDTTNLIEECHVTHMLRVWLNMIPKQKIHERIHLLQLATDIGHGNEDIMRQVLEFKDELDDVCTKRLHYADKCYDERITAIDLEYKRNLERAVQQFQIDQNKAFEYVQRQLKLKLPILAHELYLKRMRQEKEDALVNGRKSAKSQTVERPFIVYQLHKHEIEEDLEELRRGIAMTQAQQIIYAISEPERIKQEQNHD